MLINFAAIEESVIPNMRGGEKEYNVRIFNDGACKIMKGRLVPGASIGLHTHETDSEMIYILSGTGTMLAEGDTEILPAGSCHYCPKGGTHSLSNQNEEELVFLAIVPVHGV